MARKTGLVQLTVSSYFLLGLADRWLHLHPSRHSIHGEPAQRRFLVSFGRRKLWTFPAILRAKASHFSFGFGRLRSVAMMPHKPQVEDGASPIRSWLLSAVSY